VRRPATSWKPAGISWGRVTDEPLDEVGDEPDPTGGAAVTGRIVGPDGEPVPLAGLRGKFLRCRGGYGVDAGHGRAVDGRYRFRAVHDLYQDWEGPLFDIRASGYLPARVGDPGGVWAALREGRSAIGPDIVLRRAAAVEGVVTRPDGEPVPRVEVGLTEDAYADRTDLNMRVETDGEGRYRLDELDPETSVFLAAGLANDSADPVPLRGRLTVRETLRIDIVLPASNPVEIEITVENWREGLMFRERGSYSVSRADRTFTLETHTGRQVLTFAHPELDAESCRVPLSVPHGETFHRESIHLRWKPD
jgi:hypothetical protein